MIPTAPPTTTDNAKQYAEEHWNRAAEVLAARPSLMTQHILMLVLKNRPPAHVVDFMLSLNPRAADVPSEGPSPLQVAVRHNASVQVIKIVIQACPLALMATHSGYDPLMYAKIWRREEPKLLHLLSLPVAYWVEQAKANMFVAESTTESKTRLPAIEAPATTISPHRTLSPKTTSSYRRRSSSTTTTTPSDEEIRNIKTIAATIVRSQKKQVAALAMHREEVQTSLERSRTANHEERLQQLKKLEELQQSHFKAQLIALDMKEKRIMARVKKVERRVLKTLELSKEVRNVKDRRQAHEMQKLERNVQATVGTFDAFSARTEKRLELTELRLEQECRMNDYFRSDTRLQLDQLDFRASALQGWSAGGSGDTMTPVVYATPYVVEDEDLEEIDEIVPLVSNPVHPNTGRGHKRSYPKRKRRHLLGPLNF